MLSVVGCDSQTVSDVDGDRQPRTEIIEIEAKPEEGFHWGFYLSLPQGLNFDEPTYMEAEVTNTYQDSKYKTHKEDAESRVQHYRLGKPKITPVIPNFAENPGLQSLGPETFTTNDEEFYRIDLQFINMFDYARDYLKEEYGLEIFDELIFYGASSSGDWVHRFTMIHPDKVTAMSFGATTTGMMMPVKEWQGQELNYRYGINDFKDLVGKPFDLDTYRDVSKFFYLGEYEDVTGYYHFMDEPTDMIKDILPRYEQIYEDLDINGQFVIYNATAHEAPIRPEISDDVRKFLEVNVGDQYVEIDPYQFAENDFFDEFELYDEVNIIDIFWAKDSNVPDDFQAAFDLDEPSELDIIIVTEEGFVSEIQAHEFIERNGFLFELVETEGDRTFEINSQNVSLNYYISIPALDYDELKGFLFRLEITNEDISNEDRKVDYKLKVKEEVSDSYNLLADEIILESLDE